MKKHFDNELAMAKKSNEDFEYSTKCWICDNDYVNRDVKVRDHCHITQKYRGSAHRGCTTKIKVNQKIYLAFNNIKNYGSHLIIQELDKFSYKIKVIPNGLEKYMSFNISNILVFIDSFQCLSSSLDSLVKKLCKDDFRYLNHNLYLKCDVFEI